MDTDKVAILIKKAELEARETRWKMRSRRNSVPKKETG